MDAKTKKELETVTDNSFLLDGMLGSLARKLRILGYDTLYDSKSSDAELLKIARETRRLLITSDIELYLLSKRRKLDSILVVSRSERSRLYEVLSKIGEKGINESRTARCSICNGLLKDTGRRKHGNIIYACIDCGKNYWKGSHWKKMSSLFREVDAMLRNKEKIAHL